MNQNISLSKKINVSPHEDIMAYENMDVIDRFRQSWDVPLEDSIDLFIAQNVKLKVKKYQISALHIP